MEQLTEPVVGWRGYTFCHPHFLTCSQTVIQPRERMEAICTVNFEHDAPMPGCSCGFYAFTTLQELVDQGYGYQNFLAEVYLWGRIIEHEKGYRAQFCYPKTLYLPPYPTKAVVMNAEFIAWKYGVPFVRELMLPEKTVDYDASGTAITPKTRPPITLSFEDYWNAAFNDNLEVSVRRTARQRARQMVYMRQRALEKRVPALDRALTAAERELRATQTQMQALDGLKKEL